MAALWNSRLARADGDKPRVSLQSGGVGVGNGLRGGMVVAELYLLTYVTKGKQGHFS